MYGYMGNIEPMLKGFNSDVEDIIADTLDSDICETNSFVRGL